MFLKGIIRFVSWVKHLYSKPLEVHPKPVRFKDNKKAYLRYLHSEHFWRWLRFSTIGFVLMGFGFGILFLSVSMAGLKPVIGYLIENLVLVQVDFVINRRPTFGDRDIHWLKALPKWYTARAGAFGVGQAAFFALNHFFGLQYMLASLAIAMTVGILGYFISSVFTFSAGKAKLA